MYLFRPSQQTDLSGIEKLVLENEARVSSLPRNREKLSESIELSIRSFEQDTVLVGREIFVFVLEDVESGEIIATSAIKRNASKASPFYSYRQDELVHSSERLGVHTAVPVLYLTHELTGTTVLSSLAIKTDHKNTELLELVSRARLLFISQFSHLFSEQIAVELQGVQYDDERSPFWDSLGKHFFQMDFATADYYSGVKSRTFIAEMMPPYPLYVSLLSNEAQDVMGVHGAHANAVAELLRKEGFVQSKYIDIFDGGPTFLAKIDELRSVRAMQTKQLKLSGSSSGKQYLVANQSFENFSCTLTQLTDGLGDLIRLSTQCADLLKVTEGDQVSFVPIDNVIES